MDATLYKIAKSGSAPLLDEVSAANPQLLLTTTLNKNTALHIAARHEHFNFAARIGDLHPSLLLAENARGDTALHIAARTGNALVVKELIKCAENNGQAGEMVRKKNKGLNTAMHEAARNSHHRVVESLIWKDPELVLLVNAAGESPLYLAAELGARKCVDIILGWTGSTISDAHSGPHNRTPLHAAVLRGHLGMSFHSGLSQTI